MVLQSWGGLNSDRASFPEVHTSTPCHMATHPQSSHPAGLSAYVKSQNGLLKKTYNVHLSLNIKRNEMEPLKFKNKQLLVFYKESLFLFIFNYLFLAALGLHCYMGLLC